MVHNLIMTKEQKAAVRQHIQKLMNRQVDIMVDFVETLYKGLPESIPEETRNKMAKHSLDHIFEGMSKNTKDIGEQMSKTMQDPETLAQFAEAVKPKSEGVVDVESI